jgi:hypothetical protein
MRPNAGAWLGVVDGTIAILVACAVWTLLNYKSGPLRLEPG